MVRSIRWRIMSAFDPWPKYIWIPAMANGVILRPFL